jgi:CopG family nickel-responsive transcriptional regulator
MRTRVAAPDAVVDGVGQVRQDEGLDDRSRAVREATRESIESRSRLENLRGDVVAPVAIIK